VLAPFLRCRGIITELFYSNPSPLTRVVRTIDQLVEIVALESVKRQASLPSAQTALACREAFSSSRYPLGSSLPVDPHYGQYFDLACSIVGISQGEMARRAGVASSTLSRAFSGQFHVKREKLLAWEDILLELCPQKTGNSYWRWKRKCCRRSAMQHETPSCVGLSGLLIIKSESMRS
jgi:AraC-like DNA-binding protein